MTWVQTKGYNPNRHGKYYPLNKEKYIGKRWPVVRSSWERSLCKYLDSNESIVAWASESIGIPYMYRGKQRRYFPDFFVKTKDKWGNITRHIIEVKPSKECKPPQKKGKKKYQTLLTEKETWSKNQAKWKAAQDYCRKRDYKFLILTEKDLFR